MRAARVQLYFQACARQRQATRACSVARVARAGALIRRRRRRGGAEPHVAPVFAGLRQPKRRLCGGADAALRESVRTRISTDAAERNIMRAATHTRHAPPGASGTAARGARSCRSAASMKRSAAARERAASASAAASSAPLRPNMAPARSGAHAACAPPATSAAPKRCRSRLAASATTASLLPCRRRSHEQAPRDVAGGEAHDGARPVSRKQHGMAAHGASSSFTRARASRERRLTCRVASGHGEGGGQGGRGEAGRGWCVCRGCTFTRWPPASRRCGARGPRMRAMPPQWQRQQPVHARLCAGCALLHSRGRWQRRRAALALTSDVPRRRRGAVAGGRRHGDHGQDRHQQLLLEPQVRARQQGAARAARSGPSCACVSQPHATARRRFARSKSRWRKSSRPHRRRTKS